MLQLADRMHAEDQRNTDALRAVEDQHKTNSGDLAAKTVEKHWGAQPKKQQQMSSSTLAMMGQQANWAAHRYEARNVAGLELLSLGGGEMCGELALGFREPEASNTTGLSERMRKTAQEMQKGRGTNTLKPGCLQHGHGVQGMHSAKVCSRHEGQCNDVHQSQM